VDGIHLRIKPGSLFYFITSAVIIVSFVIPVPTNESSAMDIPTPTYPDNGAVTTSDTDPPLGIPSFSWTSVSGANIYRLQVDNEIEFNHPIYMDITTPNTTFTPKDVGELFPDGEWCWRVRVNDPTPVSLWSPVYRFTKTWATPNNKPVLIAPAAGENLAFFDSPAFSWTPVMGAVRYRFEIAISQFAFDPPILSVDTLSTTYQPNIRPTNGIYYWRVVPFDAMDHQGTPSNVRPFTAAYGGQFGNLIPILISPEDESEPTFTPTFKWTAIKGAEYYRLEYTSDITCDFNAGISLETPQTSYTPTSTFPNNFRYCWRVRVESGDAIGDWSLVRHFTKKWDLKPVLLTPTNLYQSGLYPLYSWTPVPGAARYLIQISLNSNFSLIYEESTTANTTYSPQSKYDGTAHYWWRVIPVDGSGNLGVVSDVSEFQSNYASAAPILIYPLFYYQPNNYGENLMNPFEDRTVAFPIFIWHRVMKPSPNGGVFADAYRIQVDTTPYFNSVVWQYETENTSATPTTADDFLPSPGQDYYWRVCPLNGLNNIDCMVNPSNGVEWWSQIWIAHFSSALELPPTTSDVPQLLRPEVAQESVEATPLFEWWPLKGATQYQIQVSRDDIFSTSEITETVNIPAYSPNHSLAQRSLGRTDYGTFYWHVRGLVGGVWSEWSTSWRFQIASQSEWQYSRTLGDPINKLQIASDPIGDLAPAYDLSKLYASQSSTPSPDKQPFWILGFDANLTSADMTYAFYIDLDNKNGSGAVAPPQERNYFVSTVTEHQPEYAIYVDVIGGVVNSENIWIFPWKGNLWGYGEKLSDKNGEVYSSTGYIELKIPNGVMGMSQDTSSASVVLFSIDTSTGIVQDSVPSNPTIPGNGLLSHFSAVSERMNLVYPPSSVTGDPTGVSSVLPFFWDWPTGSNGATPFAGSVLQVDIDPNYSSPNKVTFQISSNTSYLSENNVTLLTDIVGDNRYYWRVQPRYFIEGHQDVLGAWSSSRSFNRFGFKARNLTTSFTFATPKFSWDMAEGANSYQLQVATDQDFGNKVIDISTPMNYYSPTETLPPALYYWRVKIIRYNNIGNDWSEVKQFDLSLPYPTGLSPDNGLIIKTTPTYCWDPLIGYAAGVPVLTAWRYLVQVSTNSNFSNIYDSVETYQNCWTPKFGYNDGTYFWRVAMIDGDGWLGSYSPPATFTKSYPKTTLVSPISGFVQKTPTFIWIPVDGASTYIVEVSWYPTFYPLYYSTETINTQFTPTSIYPSSRIYYWRIAIRDRSGMLGPYEGASFINGYLYPSFLTFVSR
jgi:hypothetical protein